MIRQGDFGMSDKNFSQIHRRGHRTALLLVCSICLAGCAAGGLDAPSLERGESTFSVVTPVAVVEPGTTVHQSERTESTYPEGPVAVVESGRHGDSISRLAVVPPYEVPVGAAVQVIFEEVGPDQLIHEWQVVD